MDIQSIWMKVRRGQYVVSFSHTEKIRSRMISLEEIETAILSGTIIEPYSDDSRGPSCLIFAGERYSSKTSHLIGAGANACLLSAMCLSASVTSVVKSTSTIVFIKIWNVSQRAMITDWAG
jgi:hypothetical protein